MKLKLMALVLIFKINNLMADTTVQMSLVDAKGVGTNIGHVSISEYKYGIVFSPSLKGLIPGSHGFHLHQNPSCDPKENEGKMVSALAAGSHYDPSDTKHHDTPWGNGHLGDLPALFVDAEGNANQPVLAPRLKMADLAGRSLMVHEGADNYSDKPAPLGGGGARIGCGVIQLIADFN